MNASSAVGLSPDSRTRHFRAETYALERHLRPRHLTPPLGFRAARHIEASYQLAVAARRQVFVATHVYM
jgi:hypothetical protein